MIINAIIIEDERNTKAALIAMIETYCIGLRVLATGETVMEAVDLINKHQPDIVFLDMVLPGENGLQLFKYFPNPTFQVIVISAHDKYAIKAYRERAIHFLLKPIDPEELILGVDKVRKKIGKVIDESIVKDLKDNLNPFADCLIVPIKSNYQVISTKSIIYCQAEANYTEFHMSDEKVFLVARTLKYYEEVLEQNNFFRINRSVIINPDFVKHYNKKNNEKILMSNEVELSVAEARRKELMEKISGGMKD